MTTTYGERYTAAKTEIDGLAYEADGEIAALEDQLELASDEASRAQADLAALQAVAEAARRDAERDLSDLSQRLTTALDALTRANGDRDSAIGARDAALAQIATLTAQIIALQQAPLPFITDYTKPTPANTGPAAGGFTPKGAIAGNVVLAAGQVLEGKIIEGYVTMGSGSKLRGCVVKGQNPGVWPGINALVYVPTGLAVMPEIEFCGIGQEVPIHWNMNCLRLDGPAIVRRNNIHDGTDFIKASGEQRYGDILGNCFHDFSYRNDDADHANDNPAYVSHNDGFQFAQGIDGCNIHGNSFDMRPSPRTSVGAPDPKSSVGWGCPITVSGSSVAQRLNIHHNWASGGACGLFQANSYPAAQGTIPLGYVGENRVALDQWRYTASGSRYQVRYATGYAELAGQFTNYYDPDAPSTAAEGKAGARFVQGTAATSGVRRP